MSYPHGSWSPKSDASQGQYPDVGGGPRRPGGDPHSFAFVGGYPQNLSGRGTRQSSSSPTSSLSGAMGDTHISNPQLTTSIPSGMAWSVPQGSFVATTDEGSMSYISTPLTPASASPSGAFSLNQYQPPYNAQNFSNAADPEGFTQQFVPSPSPFSEPFSLQQARTHAMLQGHSPSTPATSSPGIPMSLPPHQMQTLSISRTSRPTQENLEDQVRHLEQTVHHLQAAREAEAQRAANLERELARVSYANSAGGSGSIPTPLPTPTLPPALEANWRARTEARKKIFCSVNRAGNALCAWHDSRRERRAYPPRNAPAGYLNCGCTYEEALFEESLSRHNVGSYHPGESVRMDPALRNPLLRLLQQRYGYRDGDFDFDAVSRTWINGEDATYWEAELASGAAVAKKNRGEGRR